MSKCFLSHIYYVLLFILFFPRSAILKTKSNCVCVGSRIVSAYFIISNRHIFIRRGRFVVVVVVGSPLKIIIQSKLKIDINFGI